MAKNFLTSVFFTITAIISCGQTIITSYSGGQTVSMGDTVILQLKDFYGNLQWQKTVDLTEWIDIAGETDSIYQFTAESPAFYRVKANAGICDPVSSDVISVYVHSSNLYALPSEMEDKSLWTAEHLLAIDEDPPFSFEYGGQSSTEILKTWKRKTEINILDDKRRQYIFTWEPEKPGDDIQVRCEATEYLDFPVVEWTVYFKNNGQSKTPNIKNIRGLDVSFQNKGSSEFILNGIKGDFCTADSYQPFRHTLGAFSSMTFAPPSNSGKSSDGPDGWPYWNLQMNDGGLIMALGWPGQWECIFKRDTSNILNIVAGQQLTNLYLKPGEEIRTPLIALLFWKREDIIAAQNLWRRWYIAHILPKVDGNLQSPVMQIQVSGAVQDTSYVKAFIDAGIKPDISWRDAGGAYTWYPSENGPYQGNDAWLNTGTWEIDAKRYPEGFRPFTDWIHKKDVKFLLWFEPERVGDPNSWLAANHPEWLLPTTSHGPLFNEGKPEALSWLISHIDGMIKSEGIDWYREDMNGAGPLPAWRANDAADRQGITENFYVQGHLKFWDELKRLNPNLWIDACASGGRRNDLETMRRAVPLLRSDFQFEFMENVVNGNQGHTYGLSSWLPFQGTGSYFYDTYSFRSFYMPGFGMGGLSPENKEQQKQAYTECRKIAPYMLYGDYYPISAYSVQSDQWIAWQFNSPEMEGGYIQAFRRENCENAEMTFHLKGINPNINYTVTNFDHEGSVKVRGRELLEKGLTVEIYDTPGSAIILYQNIPDTVIITDTIRIEHIDSVFMKKNYSFNTSYDGGKELIVNLPVSNNTKPKWNEGKVVFTLLIDSINAGDMVEFILDMEVTNDRGFEIPTAFNVVLAQTVKDLPEQDSVITVGSGNINITPGMHHGQLSLRGSFKYPADSKNKRLNVCLNAYAQGLWGTIRVEPSYGIFKALVYKKTK